MFGGGMADGLLTSGLNWTDQQKRILYARLGLLMNNPQEFAAQLGSEARQRAGVGLFGEPKTAQEMASGAWINSPYGQQAMQAVSGFAGTVNPISGTWYKGMYPFDYTKEVRTSIPNTPQWKQGIIDTGPLIDPKDINRKTPFPSFSSLPDLEGIKGFFAKSPNVANRFAPAESGAVYPVNINAEKVFTIDAKGKKAGELQFGDKSTKFRNAVNSGKYDAILIKNTADEGDIAIALTNAKIKSIFDK